MLYPLKFGHILKKKIWGGRTFKTLLDISLPDYDLYGESWEICCHPNGDSVVMEGKYKGLCLSELLKKYGGKLIGDKLYKKYNKKFPVLIKILDLNDSNSIQVHPNNEYAKKYSNESGKAEAWYVMEASGDAEMILGINKNISESGFKKSIYNKKFQGLFNKVKVKSGDFIYIQPGMVHSNIKGSLLLLEIQQNSDQTYRLYDYDRKKNGKKRELHIEKALDVIDFKANVSIKNVKRFDDKILDFSVQELISTDYFNIDYIMMLSQYDEIKKDTMIIYSVLEGRGEILYGTKKMKISTGESILIPANLKVKLIGELKIIKTWF
jgi:mannose-6-phosphate isomerase